MSTGKNRDSIFPVGIGAHIKALREALGLKQAQFAERIGVKQATVSDWENGNHEPPASTLRDIARMFDARGIASRIANAESSKFWSGFSKAYGQESDNGTKVRERSDPFGGLADADKKALKEFYEFLKEADPGRKKHIQRQIRYLLERFKGK